ncbi:MAG TPA: copper ion binding protein [Clostridia bacterium]|mgnify:CR=1 FL=1|nr:copper ion binding protein [Clostridia bacterium]
MIKKKLSIKGMTCQHCVMHVANALKELDGVEGVDVNLKGQYSVVELSKEIDEAAFTEAIEDAGYDLVGVETV